MVLERASRFFLLAADRARWFLPALLIWLACVPPVHASRSSVAVPLPGRIESSQTSPLKTRVRGAALLPVGRLSLSDFASHEPATGCERCGYEIASGLRQWLNQDPLGEEGGINLYRFVSNDAVNRYDPNGLRDGDVTRTHPSYYPGGRIPIRRPGNPSDGGKSAVKTTPRARAKAKMIEWFRSSGGPLSGWSVT